MPRATNIVRDEGASHALPPGAGAARVDLSTFSSGLVNVLRYISTRGTAPALSFDDVLLTGLAHDGGLYVPEHYPHRTADEWRALQGLPYAQLAAEVMRPFIAGSVIEGQFDRLVAEAYAGFAHAAVTPLVQLDSGLFLLELFHGPTLAFKDVALQLLGRLFDAVLEARDETLTILGATSGDTGSAAIAACKDRARLEVFILHPHNRTSEVQRRQMTTELSSNIHNIAVEGSFDDAQAIVKTLMGDAGFRDRHRLAAINSINWARIMAQTVYYVAAALALGAPERAVGFAVPTGNFGNVFAAYVARRMGLPIDALVVATNANDILARTLESGSMAVGEVLPTLSPSMDIQVSSNFERLLFELNDRDAAGTAAAMAEFSRTGRTDLAPAAFEKLRSLFWGTAVDDPATAAEITASHRDSAVLLDPHSAIAVAGAKRLRAAMPDRDTPLVALACAHAAKFPSAVKAATGFEPPLPPFLADLMQREERYEVVPAASQAVAAVIEGAASGK